MCFQCEGLSGDSNNFNGVISTITGFLIRIKVLISLKFLASGSYQRGCVAKHSLLSVCQGTVSRCLHEFLDAMAMHVNRNVIRFPQSEEERAAIKLGTFPLPFHVKHTHLSHKLATPDWARESLHPRHQVTTSLICCDQPSAGGRGGGVDFPSPPFTLRASYAVIAQNLIDLKPSCAVIYSSPDHHSRQQHTWF
ncbi:unnamed protein product [Bemisia tabaci]|uniref:Uncharacterized protein n=1 Tax=Bemisia tabaci TaxID=7038 RepID=A0A9P0CFF9_BEMTA|nr:unnamed protein product [Bemisia tabaci]